mmetsp:Transcript_102493/g.165169  ORF Transcript_102493/g.165169 Transcript_102493/m.165169 type:complete len:208 (+) Transcript_102493:1810-2433(+)
MIHILIITLALSSQRNVYDAQLRDSNADLPRALGYRLGIILVYIGVCHVGIGTRSSIFEQGSQTVLLRAKDFFDVGIRIKTRLAVASVEVKSYSRLLSILPWKVAHCACYFQLFGPHLRDSEVLLYDRLPRLLPRAFIARVQRKLWRLPAYLMLHHSVLGRLCASSQLAEQFSSVCALCARELDVGDRSVLDERIVLLCVPLVLGPV